MLSEVKNNFKENTRAKFKEALANGAQLSYNELKQLNNEWKKDYADRTMKIS